jgi:hypothetical protein
LKERFRQPLLNDTLKGNVLILKHVNHNRQQLADVTDNDISIVNLSLDGYVVHQHDRNQN